MSKETFIHVHYHPPQNSGELKGDNSGAKEPTAGQLVNGEIALNYNSADPCLFIKNSDGEVIRLAGKGAEGSASDVLTGDTPPAIDDLEPGTLWWNSSADECALYVLYDDPAPGIGKVWVEASPHGDPTGKRQNCLMARR